MWVARCASLRLKQKKIVRHYPRRMPRTCHRDALFRSEGRFTSSEARRRNCCGLAVSCSNALRRSRTGKATGSKGIRYSFWLREIAAPSVIRPKIAVDKAVYVQRRTEAVRRAVYLPLYLLSLIHLGGSPFKAPSKSSVCNKSQMRRRHYVSLTLLWSRLKLARTNFSDSDIKESEIPQDLSCQTRRETALPICRSRTRPGNSLLGMNRISRPLPNPRGSSDRHVPHVRHGNGPQSERFLPADLRARGYTSVKFQLRVESWG